MLKKKTSLKDWLSREEMFVYVRGVFKTFPHIKNR